MEFWFIVVPWILSSPDTAYACMVVLSSFHSIKPRISDGDEVDDVYVYALQGS